MNDIKGQFTKNTKDKKNPKNILNQLTGIQSSREVGHKLKLFACLHTIMGKIRFL